MNVYNVRKSSKYLQLTENVNIFSLALKHLNRSAEHYITRDCKTILNKESKII